MEIFDMRRLLTNRTVTISELREPAKVLNQASGNPVAILKNNECVGYLVPVSAVDETEHQYASVAELDQLLDDSLADVQPVLDYLKDK